MMSFWFDGWLYRMGATWQGRNRIMVVSVCDVDASGGLIVRWRVLLPLPHPAMGLDGVPCLESLPMLVDEVWNKLDVKNRVS